MNENFLDRAKQFLLELQFIQRKYHLIICAGGTGGEETMIIDEANDKLEVSVEELSK